MRPRIQILHHQPRIGEITLVIGDRFRENDSISVVVPVRGVGLGEDGALTVGDGKRAMAAALRALADTLCEEAGDA